jgi:replication-associated recombination protein RarA
VAKKLQISLDLYIPTDVSDIVFGNKDAEAIVKMVANGDYPLPAAGTSGLVLYGSNGTGKSSLAKILPNAIESSLTGNPAYSEFEQCGSSDSGIALLQNMDSKTDLISSNQSGLHYVVLDEVDLLSTTAMERLKTLMNKKFLLLIMTTNHLEKIERGVIDRSLLIEMNKSSADKWLPLAYRMLDDAGLPHPSDEKILSVIESSFGSARKISEALFLMCIEIHNKRIT